MSTGAYSIRSLGRNLESELLGLAVFHGAGPSRQWAVNLEAAAFPLPAFRAAGAFFRECAAEGRMLIGKRPFGERFTAAAKRSEAGREGLPVPFFGSGYAICAGACGMRNDDNKIRYGGPFRFGRFFVVFRRHVSRV